MSVVLCINVYPPEAQLIFLRKSDYPNGCAVLLYLVVCLTLHACFFLPSFSSLMYCTCKHTYKLLLLDVNHNSVVCESPVRSARNGDLKSPDVNAWLMYSRIVVIMHKSMLLNLFLKVLKNVSSLPPFLPPSPPPPPPLAARAGSRHSTSTAVRWLTIPDCSGGVGGEGGGRWGEGEGDRETSRD